MDANILKFNAHREPSLTSLTIGSLITGLVQPESCADRPDLRSSHPPHPFSGLPATVTDRVGQVAADSDLSLAVLFEACKGGNSTVSGVFLPRISVSPRALSYRHIWIHLYCTLYTHTLYTNQIMCPQGRARVNNADSLRGR